MLTLVNMCVIVLIMGGVMQNKSIVAKLRLPATTYEKIKKIAKLKHRNINQQITHLCEKAMLEEEQEKEKVEVGK